jgi:hypothetical protein
MTMIRVEKDKDHPYVILNKSFLEDSEISLKLKGFLAFCLAKPNDWKFHIRQLASTLKEGKDALYNIINEGIEHGYIQREQLKINGRFSNNNYIIYESKIKKISTVSGNPDTENSDAEPQTLLINNYTNNKNSNTSVAPKGDYTPRKKIKEIKKEVAVEVVISQRQEDDLLQRVNGDERYLQKIYQKLSDWKISKGITGGLNDYRTILNWVLKAVEEDEIKSPENVVNKVREWLRNNIKQETGNRLVKEGLIILGKDYIEFPKTKDSYIKYTDPGAISRIEGNLRKIGI